MRASDLVKARSLEGRFVSVALANGARLDHCRLMSAARTGTFLWLDAAGSETPVPFDEVTDLWEDK